MKIFLTGFSVFLLSANAVAHTAYIGSLKATGEPCVLEIEQTYYENNSETPENFRADIVIGLDAHDDHLKGAGEVAFTIKPSGKPQVLSGVGENQKDLINVLTAVGSNGLESPVSYAVKLSHGGHFDTAQCLNLKLANHE